MVDWCVKLRNIPPLQQSESAQIIAEIDAATRAVEHAACSSFSFRWIRGT
jgi:hypothetical protein